MDMKQDLELTIRTATLIKSLSQLIGTSDPLLAKMMMLEASEQWDALAQFVLSVQPKRAGSQRTSGGNAT